MAILSRVLVLLEPSRYELCRRIAVSSVATVVVAGEGAVSTVTTTVVRQVGRECAHRIDKDLKFQTWLQFFRIQVGHQVLE